MPIRHILSKYMLIWAPCRLDRTTARKHYTLVAPRRRTKLSGNHPLMLTEEGRALICSTLA